MVLNGMDTHQKKKKRNSHNQIFVSYLANIPAVALTKSGRLALDFSVIAGRDHETDTFFFKHASL